MAERVGQFFGNYRLLSLLGSGAFAEVYLAEHRYLGTRAAIKILHVHMEPSNHAQFQREARTIAHLQHDHIVRVLDFGFQDQIPFLVMEYTPNGTLRTKHPKGTRLPLQQIIHYVKQVAPALDYAHQQRVIHRDVKPENMLLSTKDEVRLSDFGIAVVQRSMDSLSTQNQAGTPLYMAPEQIRGKPCAASDQYALGIVVYEWLCGELPFRGSLLEILSQHLHQTPPSLCARIPSLPPAVEDAVFGALAKKPKERFASVQDFANVLEEVLEATPSFSWMASTEYLPREQRPLSVPASVSLPEDQERSLSDAQRLPVWNVPYARNPFFTGREDLLERLATALQPGQAAALSQPLAISGLGGIGKTHLAVEFAYRHRQDYQAVFWVRADMRENLLSDFVVMARELHLPAVDTQKTVDEVKAWLRTHGDWLLILDNADDIILCKEFLPPAYGGQVLLTTRAQAMGRLAQRIEVDTMPQEVGVRFLLHRAGLITSETEFAQVLPQEQKLARKLVHELGGLPLALDQAGAYMEETPCSLKEYLHLYRTRRAAVLTRRGGLVDDHPASVTTTWSLAFASVEQANPAAADLLRVCAFLHPDAIPEDLLRQGATQTESPLQAIGTDDLAFHEALRTLGAYSLLHRDLSTRTLSTHRLVQAVLIDAMTPEITQAWVQYATRFVLTALPISPSIVWWGDSTEWERLLPHVLTCTSHLLQAQLVSPEATHLLQTAGRYLYGRGQYIEAEPLFQRVLQIREQELGPRHLETAESLDELGLLYGEQGKSVEAESLFQRALAMREQQLGPTHLATVQSLRNLAWLYQEQEKYAEAEPFFQRALAIYEQELGPTHFTTVGMLSSLALFYDKRGKYAEAEQLYQQVLALQEKVMDPDPSLIAGTLQNYASLLRQMERMEEAEEVLQRSLAIGEERENKGLIGITLDHLGLVYRAQGKIKEAEEVLQRSLAIGEEREDKRHVSMALEHLGGVYRAQGKMKEAEEVLQRSLAIAEEREDKRQALFALQSLGGIYQAQGKMKEAEEVLQRSLAMAEEREDNRHIASTLQSLGSVYQAQGKLREAEEVLQRSLMIAEEREDRRHIWMTLHNLGRVYQAQGKQVEAESLFQQALAICEQDLGPTHVTTASILTNLGKFYQAQGKLKEARKVLQRALVICEQQVGLEQKQPYVQQIREDCEALLERLAGSIEGSGNISEEFPQKN